MEKIFWGIALFILSAVGTTSSIGRTLTEQCVQADSYANSKEYILNTKLTSKTEVFFLHNISKNTLVLDHPVEKVGASAGWSSYLSPGNWSAIALSKPDFAIRCVVVMKNEKSVLGDCSKLIKVCKPNLQDQEIRSGSYWLVENLVWDAFLKMLSRRGVNLEPVKLSRTPKQ